MNKDILVFGGGFIGARLRQDLDAQVSEKKIYSLEDAQSEIKKFNPEIIINCVGYIGRNVDDCELDKEKALTTNVFAPVILAEAAVRNNIRLVHISSGCIYHYDYKKDEPITEDRPPDFFELFYSRTKIYAEGALNSLSKKYPVLIARLRVPLDNRPHPRNILTKLINYKKAIDIPNSVTYIPDFIQALKYLVKIGASGIYNIANKGALRYPELLEVYKKHVPDFKYETIDYKKLNLVRTNLVLSTKKLEESGFRIRDIHEVLEECVQDYLKY